MDLISLLGPVAAKATKYWYNEVKARRAIAEIFEQGFLEETAGLPRLQLRADMVGKDVEIDKLRFHVSADRKCTIIPILYPEYFYEVTVTRTDLPGDAPKRRRFRYMTGLHTKGSPDKLPRIDFGGTGPGTMYFMG